MWNNPKIKKGDVLAGILFLCMGILVCVEAVNIRLGTLRSPQQGFFPFVAGLGIAVLALLLIVQGLTGKSTGTKQPSLRGPHTALALALLAYVAAFNILGFIIATFLMGCVLLYSLGERRKGVLAGASLACAVGTYILFNRLLNVQLADGLLEFLL